MKTVGIRIVQIGVFFALAWAALAFNDEFLRLDTTTEMVLYGFELAVIFSLIYYFSHKFFKPKSPSVSQQSQNINLGRVGRMVLIGMLLALSPFIFLFGAAFLFDFLNSSGF